MRPTVVGGVLSVVLIASLARADEPAVASTASPTVASRKRPEELFEVRLRYGVARRSGDQNDPSGSSLGYDGWTPNDPSLHAWVWPLFDGVLGFTGGIGREGFALFDRTTNERVTGGGLLRAQAGATARFRLGPARLEPVVGYSFTQIADFADAAAPTLRAATRHGLLLAARGLLDFGPVTIEGRFEYPLALAATDGSGAKASASGFGGGGGVRVAVLRTGTALWGLMADGFYSVDALAGANRAAQSNLRLGLSLDLQWKEEERSTLGALQISVALEDGTPASKAVVQVDGVTTQPAPLDAAGVTRLDSLPPGPVTVHATLEGYEAAEATAGLTAGTETPVTLRLKKQLPKVGTLLVTVIDKATKSALAGATVTVNGKAQTTDAKGTATFVELTPGAVNVEIAAAGFTAKTEAATILPALQATVATELVSAKKRDPATVSGSVRSARGGAAVQANLEIPEASIKAKADDKGGFVFRLAGGTYTVTISAKGFVTQTKQVTVKDGDQAIFNVDLQPK
ncbi:MAG: carboxypeptidase regulatory-like domain-containing protein [Archangium sp.]|nr:carboxypeptidase regulatory-like domain-containing protein [Archangium sp.]